MLVIREARGASAFRLRRRLSRRRASTDHLNPQPMKVRPPRKTHRGCLRSHHNNVDAGVEVPRTEAWCSRVSVRKYLAYTSEAFILLGKKIPKYFVVNFNINCECNLKSILKPIASKFKVFNFYLCNNVIDT